METAISILFTLFYDILLLLFIVVMLLFLCRCVLCPFVEVMSFGNRLLDCVIAPLGAFLCILFIYSSADAIYTMTNKAFGNPKPSCQIELYENGEIIIVYQDTTHFCNAKDENSTWFKSRIPIDRKPSKKDICENCGRDYTHHDTHEEQRFFNSVNSTCYSISYSSVFDLKTDTCYCQIYPLFLCKY